MQLSSPAKINLFLHVTGRRPDGYHELVTLITPVTLFDTIELTVGGAASRVRCSAADVPQDAANLAWKAASAFFESRHRRFRIPPEAFQIVIHKQIPVGAGMGGGSSNAAAVLLGLNRHYDNPLPLDALMELGRALGADVPFFVNGRPALATGVGDRLHAVDPLVAYPVVLVYPGIRVDTGSVYKSLNLGLTKKTKGHRNVSFRERKYDVLHDLHNDLETVTAIRHPEIQSAKDALLRHGALGALMTGSGSAVFGLFQHRVEARRARQSIAQVAGWTVHQVDMIQEPG